MQNYLQIHYSDNKPIYILVYDDIETCNKKLKKFIKHLNKSICSTLINLSNYFTLPDNCSDIYIVNKNIFSIYVSATLPQEEILKDNSETVSNEEEVVKENIKTKPKKTIKKKVVKNETNN